jgi:hypothetical protein
MHRFQSQSIITRFRFASLLLCLKYLLIPAIVTVFIYSMFQESNQFLIVAMALTVITVVIVILQWILAQRTRCPLCLTPTLASKKCSKHRNSTPLFGSYRLKVALSVLFRGWFRCPYCNEPSAMKVRERQR